MAKHYALWPSRYSDCTDPEKLNLMPFVDEEVTNLGEFLNTQTSTFLNHFFLESSICDFQRTKFTLNLCVSSRRNLPASCLDFNIFKI